MTEPLAYVSAPEYRFMTIEESERTLSRLVIMKNDGNVNRLT